LVHIRSQIDFLASKKLEEMGLEQEAEHEIIIEEAAQENLKSQTSTHKHLLNDTTYQGRAKIIQLGEYNKDSAMAKLYVPEPLTGHLVHAHIAANILEKQGDTQPRSLKTLGGVALHLQSLADLPCWFHTY
jgi:hypothetical protein